MHTKLWSIVGAVLLLGVAVFFIVRWAGRPSGPHVILISIDSLRADHLGCYGHSRDTSPFLDEFASSGVVFETAVSSSSWTIPAHAAMFTGLPDRVHGCIDEFSWLDRSRKTIAEAFREAGYQTVGFFSGPPLHPNFGFGQGFDSYHDCTTFSETSIGILKGDKVLTELEHKPNTVVTNGEVLDAVDRWLKDATARPLFMFIHMWDVHYDYQPPQPYDRLFDPDYRGPCTGREVLEVVKRPADWTDADVAHLQALYDGEIRWTDETVRKICERLEARFGAENLLIVITSDHGEAFYEHGVHGHRLSLHEEEIRVPLLIRYPSRIKGNRRVENLVSLVDLAPTVLDLAGIHDGLPDAYGRSLAPLLRDPSARGPDRPALCEVINTQTDLHLFALRTPEWKLILDIEKARFDLYDLRADPGEQRVLEERDYPRSPGEISALYKQAVRELADLARRNPRPTKRDTPAISEMTEAQLRSLGYLK